eukprot:TRINITY_DN6098_c0_g1_i1.p1 TRINITY_DN6098_c0_g1~~TRINITY_DN6098_c0_g1_i1.p1  ORF type:complete len:728 (+),score=303.82 TRINITY_DN6098_c0_g1_i1:73-2256(+)
MGRRKIELKPEDAARLLTDHVLRKAYPEAEELLGKGVKLDFLLRVEGDGGEDVKVRTVLHSAVEACNTEAIEWLASKNANANIPMERGATVLHWCVANDKVGVLRAICDAGFKAIDLAKRNAAGLTPTQLAISLKNVEVARVLLNAGAKHDFNEKNYEEPPRPEGEEDEAPGDGTAGMPRGREPAAYLSQPLAAFNQLQYACCEGDLELLDTLHELGCSPFQRTDMGDTLLHVAVAHRKWASVDWLVEKGVPLAAHNTNGHSVLSVLVQDRAPMEDLQALKERGLDANDTDRDGTPVIYHAIANNDIDTTSFLLDLGATITATDRLGNTAAHVAAQLDAPDIITKLTLLDEKKNGEFNINVENKQGGTPLHTACQLDKHETAAFILTCRNVNQNVQNRKGATPLHVASRYGARQSAEILLSKNVEKTDDVVQKKPPPKGKKDAQPAEEARKTELEIEDSEGNTALQVAMEQNQPEVVKVLIAHHVSVKRSSKKHGTLLHQSIHAGTVDITMSLLEGGASVHERDQDDMTPLHVAVSNGCASTVKLLLKQGAGIGPQDEPTGSTPLHVAAKLGMDEITSLLIEHGADIEVRDHRCMTPLHYASERGSIPTMAILFSSGADPNVVDINKRSALHHAAAHNHKDAVQTLLDHGADVHVHDKDRWAPMHVCAASGAVECAKLLIAAGAKINEPDTSERIPLILASENSRVQMARLLVSSWIQHKAKLKTAA